MQETWIIPGLVRSPGGGYDNPLQDSCLADPHGQSSLAGYSPRGLKELDTAERLSTAQRIVLLTAGTMPHMHPLDPVTL